MTKRYQSKRKQYKARNKMVTYQQLRDCYVFRHYDEKGNIRVYTKVSDSHAIDERTGKDCIFAVHDRVEPLYPATVDLL